MDLFVAAVTWINSCFCELLTVLENGSKKMERLEVLTIGDELLDGRVADTNTLRLADALVSVGWKISQRTTIPDDFEAIEREVSGIVDRGAKICVVSGGLGPTSDDITAEAFAKILGVDLVRDQSVANGIEDKIKGLGRPVTANQLKQADRPIGSTIIHNPVGTAPGFSLRIKDCLFVAVPGVPHEYDHLVSEAIIKPLREEGDEILIETFISFGLAEAQVDEKLSDIHKLYEDVRLGYRAKFPEVHVTLKVNKGKKALLGEAVSLVKKQLGNYIIGTKVEPFATSLVNLLTERKSTVSVAESCTGGGCGNLITEVSGSSSVFNGGVITYSNQMKVDLLGVSESTLDQYGAVSEETVKEMAKGVCKLTSSDYGLAISGIAGPKGATPTKSVGTICLAIASRDWVQAKTIHLPLDRSRNKVMAACYGIDFLRRYLLD